MADGIARRGGGGCARDTKVMAWMGVFEVLSGALIWIFYLDPKNDKLLVTSCVMTDEISRVLKGLTSLILSNTVEAVLDLASHPGNFPARISTISTFLITVITSSHLLQSYKTGCKLIM